MEIGIFIIGLLAGVFSGLFGIGGGIIMVPTLIAIFGMNILNANATSLAAMLLPVGVFGVINYYKAGYVNIKESLLIAIGLFVGSFFGATIAIHVHESLLSKLYAIYLLYIALNYLDIKSYLFPNKNKSNNNSDDPVGNINIWMFIGLGVFAGVIAGVFGKGGGLIIVPILIKYFRYDPKAATATSLTALQLPVGLPSVIVYANKGYLNYVFAALMAFGIFLGVFFGSKIALNISNTLFKKVYAIFLLGVATYMIFKYV